MQSSVDVEMNRKTQTDKEENSYTYYLQNPTCVIRSLGKSEAR